MAIAPEDYAIDYDPKSKGLLTFNKSDNRNDDEPDHYTLWRMDAGSDSAKPIVRWKVDTSVFEVRKAFAKIIDNRTVLTKTEKNTYAAWDVADGKNVYWIKTQSFFDVPMLSLIHI